MTSNRSNPSITKRKKSWKQDHGAAGATSQEAEDGEPLSEKKDGESRRAGATSQEAEARPRTGSHCLEPKMRNQYRPGQPPKKPRTGSDCLGPKMWRGQLSGDPFDRGRGEARRWRRWRPAGANFEEAENTKPRGGKSKAKEGERGRDSPRSKNKNQGLFNRTLRISI